MCNPTSCLVLCATRASFFSQQPHSSDSVKSLAYATLLVTPFQNPVSTTAMFIVAIVDTTHVGSAIASFTDLVTVAQENTTI